MGIAAGMKDIVQDIVSSRDVRLAEVKGLKGEANEMLGSFKASHKKMGAQLWRELAGDKAKMAAEVKAMRSGFQSSHKEMSTELKKELTQGAAVRKPEVAGMLGDFQKSRKLASAQLRRELADYDRRIESEVAGMRQETKADLGEARTAWQELTRATTSARPSFRGDAGRGVPAGEELPDLQEKLLAAVNEHPAGITLAEVAGSLGIATIVLGRTVRKLVDAGKVRREDRTYFPSNIE